MEAVDPVVAPVEQGEEAVEERRKPRITPVVDNLRRVAEIEAQRVKQTSAAILATTTPRPYAKFSNTK